MYVGEGQALPGKPTETKKKKNLIVAKPTFASGRETELAGAVLVL